MASLRTLVKIEMRKRKWSSYKLALEAKVPYSTVWRFVTGKSFPRNQLALSRIVRTLGIKVSYDAKQEETKSTEGV